MAFWNTIGQFDDEILFQWYLNVSCMINIVSVVHIQLIFKGIIYIDVSVVISSNSILIYHSVPLDHADQ